MDKMWCSRRAPFNLVTNAGLIPIFGAYVIDRPSTSRETGRLRYAGFRPGDEVLVVGTTAKGGISAVEVSGGTRGFPEDPRGAACPERGGMVRRIADDGPRVAARLVGGFRNPEAASRPSRDDGVRAYHLESAAFRLEGPSLKTGMLTCMCDRRLNLLFLSE